jgi:endogenous inhibitor of DNA gyrase (YacG/DUF329 family)
MSINTIINCDTCGAVKGETNHWFRLVAHSSVFRLQPWGMDNVPDTNRETHHCSDQCVAKELQRWLDAQHPPIVTGTPNPHTGEFRP